MSFTTDATSGIGIPQNSTEWGDSSLAPDVSPPDHLWLMQESLGDLSDSIGSMTLNRAGLPNYQQSISGWATKGINVSGNSGVLNNGQGFSTNSTLIDPTTKSIMWLMYVDFIAATNLKWAGTTAGGGVKTVRSVASTTPRYGIGITSDVSDVFGTVSPISTVRPVLMQYDRTNGLCRIFMDNERVDCTYDSGVQNAIIRGSIGSYNTYMTSGDIRVFYSALWIGANAEIGDWQIRNFFRTLGWTVGWPAIYTAGLSASISVSDSIAEVVASFASPSDSLAESDATAAVTSAAIAPADTDTVTDLLGTVTAAPVAVAETDSVGDGTVGVVLAAVDVSIDAETIIEVLTPASSAPIALTESETETEADVVGQIFHNALTAATVTIAETATVGTGLPTIHAISPAPGVAPGTLGAFSGNYETAVNTEIVIQIFDDGEDLATESVVDGDAMMVFQNGAFFGRYVARSYLVFLSNGVELHILPGDNWQGTSVQLNCSATDTLGHLASVMFSWQLPAVTAVQLPPRLLPPVVPAGQVDHVANALRLITDQFRSKL